MGVEKSKILYFLGLVLSNFSSLSGYPCDGEIESAYMSVFSRELGYTLQGAKPASIDELEHNYHMIIHPEATRVFLDSLKKSFKNSKNYILKIFSEEDVYYQIELINKKSIKNLILRNKIVNIFIAENFENESEFYKKLEDPTVKLFHIFRNDPYLIGLVLGYGYTNSEFYCRKVQVGRYLKKPPFEFFLPFYKQYFLGWPWMGLTKKNQLPYKIKKPDVNPGFSSLESEWEWIRKVEWDLDKEREPVPPYLFALPFYICRHGGDSELIREKFKRARVELAKLFCGNSFRQAVADKAQQ